MKKFFQSITAFEVVLVLSVLLVGTASYGLGRFSALQETSGGGKGGSGVEIRNMEPIKKSSAEYASPLLSSSSHESSLVASKNGTKYYFPTCSGASRILEKNKVTFQTPEEAERAGYTLASGCGQ